MLALPSWQLVKRERRVRAVPQQPELAGRGSVRGVQRRSERFFRRACTACTQLANHDFAMFGLNGWYMLVDTFSYPGGLFAASAGGTCPATPPRNCLGDITGSSKPGSNVLVSSNHTVLPSEVLTVTVAADITSFAVSSPDTMQLYIQPPAPIRSQARIDVYDATNIEAGPYLGNLIGNAGFSTLPPYTGS